MKTKYLFLFLISIFLVLTFTGCSDDGSNGGGGDENGKVFVVTDIFPKEGFVEDFSVISGKGIKFKGVGADAYTEMYVSLKLYDDGTFSHDIKIVFGGIPVGDAQITGTWRQEDLKIITKATTRKDHISGETTSDTSEEVLNIFDEGKTLVDDDASPRIDSILTYTKQ